MFVHNLICIVKAFTCYASLDYSMVSMRFIVTVRVRHQMDIYLGRQIWCSLLICFNWTGTALFPVLSVHFFLNKLCLIIARKFLVVYLNATGYALKQDNSFM